MEPIILASARKHGVADEDILHAYRNAVRSERGDDHIMIVGPARNGAYLEIGIATARDLPSNVIVHAMPARPKFLRPKG